MVVPSTSLSAVVQMGFNGALDSKSLLSSPNSPSIRLCRRTDLAQDFSLASNPNGPWSYGTVAAIGDVFIPFTISGHTTDDHGLPIEYWQIAPNVEPTIYHNATTSTGYANNGQSVFPPGAVWFHPGADGTPHNFGVVRFTVPDHQSGLYRLGTAVRTYFDGPNGGDSDFHIVTNGTEVFTAAIGIDGHASYGGALALEAGETLDFLIGRGADQRLWASGLKIQAVLALLTNTSPPIVITNAESIAPPSGLVSWWPLDGNAEDVIDQDNGTLDGDPSFVEGLVGPALLFDGTNDSVRVPASSSLNVGAGNGLTLELWIKPSQVDHQAPLLEWSDTNSIVGLHVWMSTVGLAGGGPGNIFANLIDTDGNAHQISSTTGLLDTNRFHHLALTYDKASGVAQIYHDGQVVLEQTVGSFDVETRPDLYFGWRPLGSAGGDRFAGVMDEISLYGRALESTEIQSIFAAGTAGKIKPEPPPPPSAGLYDLSAGFSTDSNPNGPWSFGWVSTFDGPFTVLEYTKRFFSDNGVPIAAYQQSATELPFIGQVEGDQTAISDNGRFTAEPGTVYFAPGDDGTPRNFGVIRFTVPADAAGDYDLRTAVASLFSGTRSRDADFHVVKNGQEVFGKFMESNSETGYTNVVSLATGDTLDFAVGRGADGETLDTGLKIKASLTLLTVVSEPPVITLQPEDQTVTEGGAAHFAVSAEGTQPLSYQWLMDGLRLPDETNASLVLSNVQASQAGDYTVVVANAVGSVTSAVARLTVTSGPVPGHFDAASDFSLASNPNGPWSYGAMASVGGMFHPFSIKGLTPDDHGLPIEYWQLVPQVDPTVFHNSNEVAAIAGGGQGVFPPGSIWVNSGTDGASNGFGVIRFTVPADKAGIYRLETVVGSVWDGSLSGDNEYRVTRNGQEVFGEFLAPRTGTNYSNVLSLAAGDTLDFMVGRGQDGIGYGSGLKVAISLTLATNAPVDQTFDVFGDYSPGSNPSGVWSYGWKQTVDGDFSNLTYQIVSSDDRGSLLQGWSFASGQPPAIFFNTTTNTLVSDGGVGQYPPGTVWYAPGLDGQPQNYGAIRFTVPSDGGGLYLLESSVHTYLDSPPGGDADFHVVKDGVEVFGQFLAPATGTGYTNTWNLAPGQTIDFLVGRGQDGHLSGSGLKINAKVTRLGTAEVVPVIVMQPESQTVPGGADVIFSVEATGTALLSYQWQFNGVVMSDETNASLVLSNVQPSQAGDYVVVVANSVGAVTSAVARLTVTSPPVPGHFDVAADFSLASNPNGPWSYGAMASVGGMFHPFSIKGLTPDDHGLPIEYWQLVPQVDPTVFHNSNEVAAIAGGGQGVFPPGSIWVNSGTDGKSNGFGVIRFTVPADKAGIYRLETVVGSVWDGSLSGDNEYPGDSQWARGVRRIPTSAHGNKLLECFSVGRWRYAGFHGGARARRSRLRIGVEGRGKPDRG